MTGRTSVVRTHTPRTHRRPTRGRRTTLRDKEMLDKAAKLLGEAMGEEGAPRSKSAPAGSGQDDWLNPSAGSCVVCARIEL